MQFPHQGASMSGEWQPLVLMPTTITELIRGVIQYQHARDVAIFHYNQIYALLERAAADNGEWFEEQAERDPKLVPTCYWFAGVIDACAMRSKLLACLKLHMARTQPPAPGSIGLLKVQRIK